MKECQRCGKVCVTRKGLCPGHYAQVRRGEPLRDLKPQRPQGTRGGLCRCGSPEQKNSAHCKECAKWCKVKSKYGITQEDYLEMLLNQGGVCAICGEAGVMLCIDHDHATGKIRGLLCAHCNHGLGKFKDRRDLLARASEYLERSEGL